MGGNDAKELDDMFWRLIKAVHDAYEMDEWDMAMRAISIQLTNYLVETDACTTAEFDWFSLGRCVGWYS